MRTILTLFLLAVCPFCFAGGDTNIIAVSDWSNPVGTYSGNSLRARMIVAYGRGKTLDSPWLETKFYLEFQNVSNATGFPIQFYFDPRGGLRCVLQTADGKRGPQGGAGSGGGAG